MTLRPGLAALSASGLALGLASCGGEAARPAHRPISVIYVAGQPAGPWASRTEGLADGVKLAIADHHGLAGDRAISVAVTPILQRDGAQVNAAIGTGRILRDSRTLAVLGTYSAPQLGQSAAQLNGGETALLQYGSGMRGLLQPDRPGEPGVYQPSGRSLALRGVPSDDAVAEAIAALPLPARPAIVADDAAFRAQRAAANKEGAAAAEAARADAIKSGAADHDLPSSTPGSNQSLFGRADSDAVRLANRVRAHLVRGTFSSQPSKGSQILIIDAEQPDPAADARAAARRSTGTLVIVDAADRPIPAAAVAGHAGPVYRIRRTLDDATSGLAARLRARERATFGRDRGDAVVAGYRAAQRILRLAAAQPGKTIDRVAYATALTADAPTNADLPVAHGQVTSGAVVTERLSGGRWVAAR